MAGTQQKQAFLAHEADAWFERNKHATTQPTELREALCRHIAAHLPHAQTTPVLEIGCGHGNNLLELARHAPIRGFGIDPSAAAIAFGQAQHPGLMLAQGTADALTHADGTFGLVLFGFCLYLFDRSLIFPSIAQADRVLAEGGLLALIDFDPVAPHRRPYRDQAGLYSFKQDYARLFLAHPTYQLVAKHSLSMTQMGFADCPDERIGLWILRKDTAAAYPCWQEN